MVDPRQTVVFRWLAAGDAGDLDAFDDLLLLDPRDSALTQPLRLRDSACD
jgi:hypothetical protein